MVEVAYSGVNFIDVYYRTGLYKSDSPIVLGSEAAGRLRAWDRTSPRLFRETAWPMRWFAALTPSTAVVPSAQLVKIPDAVDFRTAAAVILQGMTAHYLTHSTFPLEPGNSCLVHAAAGGTGGLIVQMARHLGARVFGTVSTDDKARQVRDLGADEVIIYTTQDFEAEVKRLTGGRGVDVVYDSVGKTTFDKSLNVLRPRGTMALFGQSSGPVPPFDPRRAQRARVALPDTSDALAPLLDRKELLWRADDVFTLRGVGVVKVRIAAPIRSPKPRAPISIWKVERRWASCC